MWFHAAFASLLVASSLADQTGNHPEWPRWCGKVYQPQYSSFNPGGQSVEPPALPNGPALNVQFKPRYNIYLHGEAKGEFVVNAEISKWYGQPWPSLGSPEKAPQLVFTISLVSNDDVLVSNKLKAGSTGNVFEFDFKDLQPSFDPYEVVLFGAGEGGSPNVTATSEFYLLPEKTSGSVTKLDNLNGGLLFRNKATGGQFEPLLPYGFYAECDGFLCDSSSVSKIKAYSDLGLNGMVPLTPIFNSRPAFEFMDAIDLKFMYDLRSYYKNLTAVTEQVSAVKDFEAVYAYWGFDEPDGWQDPFELPAQARETIRKIDPYHPVSVTLNCQNYYFKEYTASADFIMEDVYPIAINGTFSKWGTPCNATYGDCGCDNCEGNVQDVSNRLNTLAQYERWHDLWPKTKVHNPQSFHGEDYWFRNPTAEEEVAMNALGFNHHAKSIISWVWPTSDELAQIHGKFASVVTKNPVRDFIVTTQAHPAPVPGYGILDVAYWRLGNQVLVSAINGGYDPIQKSIKIPLPDGMSPGLVTGSVWGNSSWSIVDHMLTLNDPGAMSTNMVIFIIR
ncbi:hypothetical protein PT974_06882 [Cladobotryum mycophilum]|uniref:Uncharacterized protein n=1 Tax=Cladobotryum mycophilum TaxID=491253 RepID=A0ABR0SNT8_9HYPO